MLPSQGIPPHWACSVSHAPHTTSPSRSSRGLFEPVSWRWRRSSDLQSRAWGQKVDRGRKGGRKGGGGSVFIKALSGVVADKSLIISTLCSDSVTALREACNNLAPYTQGCPGFVQSFAIKRRLNFTQCMASSLCNISFWGDQTMHKFVSQKRKPEWRLQRRFTSAWNIFFTLPASLT